MFCTTPRSRSCVRARALTSIRTSSVTFWLAHTATALRAAKTLLAHPACPSATAQGMTCTGATTPASRIRSTAAKRASWDAVQPESGSDERAYYDPAKAKLQRVR
eukprot:5567178-Pleurochrysis_carterae.AAC.1